MSDQACADIFNLVHGEWLPIQRRSGVVERIAPLQVTECIHEDPVVAFAWPRPDFNGAAHEFLIGLLSTAAAPSDDDEWAEWWFDPPAPAILAERFAKVAPAFDLDGPGPRFLQDLDPLEEAEEKGVAALLIDAPGAHTLRNNADLFVKRSGAPVLCRAAAAMALYTLSAYAPSGGAGHRTSLRGGGPLTTLVVASHESYGATLWGRLWPNVETKEQIGWRTADMFEGDDLSAVFPWLVPTRTSNPRDSGRPTTPEDVHPLQVYWGMPRRMRLSFGDAEGQCCGLTGGEDTVVVASYRTKNYGTDYSEGFEHPLTPYYRQKQGTAKLPVHPRPGGISYRLWPGLVVPSSDGLRDPAPVVRQWQERQHHTDETRFTAFGYDMDNMKARAWVEGEMPLWRFADGEKGERLAAFINQATAGAGTVARLLTGAVKSALYGRPSEASGDYDFLAERFYRETERTFYVALREALQSFEDSPDVDDPSVQARENWVPVLERAALWIFDEVSPADGMEGRDMHRYVKARFFLKLALGGYGKAGRSLFKELDIVSPDTAQSRRKKESP